MGAVFKFQAQSPDGKMVTGELEAASELEVKSRLRAGGYVPLKIVSGGKAKAKRTFELGGGSVSPKDLQVFSKQFAVLIESGVPLVESLTSLQEASPNQTLKKALSAILDDIKVGKTLAESMKKFPKIFDTTYTNLVRAGEEAGVLEEVLNRTAVYIEKSNKLKAKVKGAMLYPAITLFVAISAVVIILVFVIPKFQVLFADNGKQLPGLTQMVIDLSEFIQTHWYVPLFIIVGIPMILGFLYRNTPLRISFDKFFLKIPVFGSLIQRSVLAKMSRTMGTLLRAGVRLNEAIDVTLGTTGNLAIEEDLKLAKESIMKGKTLSEPLAASKYFPSMTTQMISVGEKTGRLDNMLEKVADFYEQEVETATDSMSSLIEPLLIVVLGGIVGTLVIAMFLPIFQLGDVVGG